MKKIIFLSLLLTTSVYAETAYITARDAALPGKHVYGSCDVFGQYLLKQLKQQHIEAYLIRYYWKYGLQHGYHTCVAFKDGNNFYIQDNQRWLPQWVSDSDFIVMLREFQWEADELKIMSVTE